jgi:hypothetical protein
MEKETQCLQLFRCWLFVFHTSNAFAASLPLRVLAEKLTRNATYTVTQSRTDKADCDHRVAPARDEVNPFVATVTLFHLWFPSLPTTCKAWPTAV